MWMKNNSTNLDTLKQTHIWRRKRIITKTDELIQITVRTVTTLRHKENVTPEIEINLLYDALWGKVILKARFLSSSEHQPAWLCLNNFSSLTYNFFISMNIFCFWSKKYCRENHQGIFLFQISLDFILVCNSPCFYDFFCHSYSTLGS